MDDFQLSFVLVSKNSRTVIERDTVTVEFDLPPPYQAADVDLKTLRLIDGNFHAYAPISPEAVEATGSHLKPSFRSLEAVRQLRAGNPDHPGAPAVARVKGRLTWGEYSIPFFAGVTGPKPPVRSNGTG